MSSINLSLLLHRNESETLDFKRDQYLFYDRPPEDKKAELLKDIIAFANAWKDGDAHIVIGVAEEHGRAGEVVGVESPLRDNDAQEFVNSKTNRSVLFLVETLEHEGKNLTVIKINQAQSRPLFLTKDYGRLRRNVVYIRRGSSTSEATPDEIAEMGREEVKAPLEEKRPDILLELQYCLQTWWERGWYGPTRNNPKPHTEHVLRVVAHNQGTVLAQYIQGSIEMPAAVLWHRMDPERVPTSLEDAPTFRFSLTNDLRDPPTDPIGMPSAPKRRPLLPGGKLELLCEKLFPLPKWVESEHCVIRWKVQGDNGLVRTGSALLRDVPKLDTREVPDAELG